MAYCRRPTVMHVLWESLWPSGYRAGLRIERSGFAPGRGRFVAFLGKTLNSHGVEMGTGEFNAGGNPTID